MTTEKLLQILDRVSISADETIGTVNNVVLNLAVIIIFIQLIIVVLKKQNHGDYQVWGDITEILLCGGFVFCFDFLFQGFDYLCESLFQITTEVSKEVTSPFQEMIEQPQNPVYSNSAVMMVVSNFLQGGGNVAKSAMASGSDWLMMNLLKPVGDFLNTLVYPSFWLQRKLLLYLIQIIAPLVIVVGAIKPFRELWKKWFLLYAAVWCTGPALAISHIFIEQAYAGLVGSGIGSVMMWYLMVSFCRHKIYQGSVDFMYKVFNC